MILYDTTNFQNLIATIRALEKDKRKIISVCVTRYYHDKDGSLMAANYTIFHDGPNPRKKKE